MYTKKVNILRNILGYYKSNVKIQQLENSWDIFSCLCSTSNSSFACDVMFYTAVNEIKYKTDSLTQIIKGIVYDYRQFNLPKKMP